MTLSVVAMQAHLLALACALLTLILNISYHSLLVLVRRTSSFSEYLVWNREAFSVWGGKEHVDAAGTDASKVFYPSTEIMGFY